MHLDLILHICMFLLENYNSIMFVLDIEEKTNYFHKEFSVKGSVNNFV